MYVYSASKNAKPSEQPSTIQDRDDEIEHREP
jgi:hypothetical protein